MTITRRGAIGSAAALLPGWRRAHAAEAELPNLPIERGAALRVLRPSRFVDPDETLWRRNTERFTQQFGVPVRVDFVGWEDLRPQTAAGAAVGAGADIVVGWPDDPHLYADKLVGMSDVAEHLGRRYDGWMFLAELYGRRWGTSDWISLPMASAGGPLVYRKSWLREAGFEQAPDDLDQFLTLCQRLKQNGHPAGFALGNAVGDANGFCSWLLWTHKGSVVDEDGRVALDRRETYDALEYARALYPHLVEGVTGWNDTSNNRAFLAGRIGLTANSASIYYAFRNDPRTQAEADDTFHQTLPKGPVGRTGSSGLLLNAMLFRHSPFPNAAKRYLAFMMEQEQYEPWMAGSLGYWAPTLRAYRDSDAWTRDPKIAVFRDFAENRFWNGYKGPITAASGAVTADYVLVHMFAAVATGAATPQTAVRDAAQRARRFYRG